MFEGDNDRVKLFTLFCGDEDEKVIRAASGALAILSTSEVVCRKILEVNYSHVYTDTITDNIIALDKLLFFSQKVLVFFLFLYEKVWCGY